MIVPAAAQSVTIGVGSGDRSMHRGDGVVVHSRTHVRPRTDRVVIIKKRRPPGHAYGLYKPRHNRTVIIRER
jgi:hypothetical protein